MASLPANFQTTRQQRRRRLLQLGFFVLFLLAPALDLLRFDLHESQLWVLGQRLSLGIDDLLAGRATAAQTALTMLLRGLLPAVVLVGGFLAVAWRWGRLYCGWLCPHLSMVELINGLLQRAAARLSLWDRERTPRADGRAPDARWWPAFGAACVLGGFVWSITLLGYLLPPAEIWHGLLNGSLSAGPARFLFIAWGLFTLEFAFARHLFCRFGCAVGLFQSLAWMANPRAMVVSFQRPRAKDCRECTPAPGSACDAACPMRLRPREIKRLMFSCVQCGQCLQACEHSQAAREHAPLLQWQVGTDALRETLRQRRSITLTATRARPADEPARTTPPEAL